VIELTTFLELLFKNTTGAVIRHYTVKPWSVQREIVNDAVFEQYFSCSDTVDRCLHI